MEWRAEAFQHMARFGTHELFKYSTEEYLQCIAF